MSLVKGCRMGLKEQMFCSISELWWIHKLFLTFLNVLDMELGLGRIKAIYHKTK